MPELTGPDQEVVLMCSEGYSSALSADLAQRELGLRNVADLEGGFAAWKEAGLPGSATLPTNSVGPEPRRAAGATGERDGSAFRTTGSGRRRSLAGEHGDPVSTGVQSVERALGILRALSTGPARVTDIAARTRLPKSTVSRLLSTLEGLDAVEQDGAGGPYRLGPLVLEIAGSVGPARALPDLARPFLLELSLLTGEAAGLSVLEGDMVRYLAQTTPADEVQVRDWTGRRCRCT